MDTILKALFFLLVVRPITSIVVGINVRRRSHLPKQGPAILAANHNSHLDSVVLMSLFPFAMLSKLRPVAAADYFLKNPLLRWFSTHIIGIIPIQRGKALRRKALRISRAQMEPPGKMDQDLFAEIDRALGNNEIIIFFPEGSRGEPEKLAPFKSGISILAERHPDVPIIPIFLSGLGRVLPKGESLLIPFFSDAVIGTPIYWQGKRAKFMQDLRQQILEMAAQCKPSKWDE